MAAKTGSLLPREHGAYAQMGVALLAALALAPGVRSLSQAVVTAALFFASEPLLVLMGRRGEAALTEQRDAAARRLTTLGGLATLALAGAWARMPVAFGLALAPPALLGLALFALFLAGRERTGLGEVIAAWAFAAATPAVVLLGGGGVRRAALLALLLAALFTLGTAVVHGHLISLRKGSTGAPRLGALLFGFALAVAAWWLGGRGLLPRSAFAVFLPMTLAAAGIWLVPPAPRRLKAVGWAAAACALAGGAAAVVGLA
jgi:hypothetical protein